VRGWEASGTIGVVKPDIPTVAEAVTQFLADAIARKLAASTISKQRNVLEKRLLPWCEGNPTVEKPRCACGAAIPCDVARRSDHSLPEFGTPPNFFQVLSRCSLD
jgi:hypothetical protein